MDYSIKIGGEAGQGIQTIGDTLARVFSRVGYYVISHQDYESRIRGGHNFFQIRFSDKQVMASRDMIDILVALDKESISLHEKELSEYGHIIYDSSSLRQKHEKSYFLNIPFVNLAIEHGGSKIMANTVATGAVLGMLKIELDVLLEIIKNTFKKKGEDVIKANIKAAIGGHDYAVKQCIRCAFSVGVKGGSALKPKMLIAGVEAIGFGAIASGCKINEVLFVGMEAEKIAERLKLDIKVVRSMPCPGARGRGIGHNYIIYLLSLIPVYNQREVFLQV